jgi:dTDP-4-amino-4,6-dideoxygalactose transaminase
VNVQLADLAALDRELGAELRAAVDRVAASGRFVLGPEVAAFEQELAHRWGLRHAVGVASGTDALWLALVASGVVPGDVVVTTPLAFVASVEAIARAGAVPRFVDVDDATLCLDPKRLREYLEGCRIDDRGCFDGDACVSAIVPVHLYGRACSAEVSRLARAAGIALVHDAAQAVCARDEDGPVGAGGAACVSFHPSKNLGAWGDGGAVLTDDGALAERVRSLRVHGRRDDRYAGVGANSRLDELQAAVLRCKLGVLDEHERRRRDNARRYHELLRGVTLPPAFRDGDRCHLYTVRVEERDAVRARLAERGIATGVYYPRLLSDEPVVRARCGEPPALPIARAATRTVLSLPVHPFLPHDALEHVAAQMNGLR